MQRKKTFQTLETPKPLESIRTKTETILEKMEYALQKKWKEKKNLRYGVRNEDVFKQKAIDRCNEAIERRKRDEEMKIQSGTNLIEDLVLAPQQSEKTKFRLMKNIAHKGLVDNMNKAKREREQKELETVVMGKIKSSLNNYFKVNLTDKYKIKRENIEQKKVSRKMT